MTSARLGTCEEGCTATAHGAHHHIVLDDTTIIHVGDLETCDNDVCGLLLAMADKQNGMMDDLVSELGRMAGWWVDTAKQDAEKTLPKAIEYGSLDFDLMGVFMTGLLGDRLEGADAKEKAQVGQEMAVLFYLIGKLGRAIGAYNQGKLPSDDTLFDVSIYSMMWRKIRETGRWV